jgi:hypothetical protein
MSSRKTKRYAEIRRLILAGKADAKKAADKKKRHSLLPASHRMVDAGIYMESFRKEKKRLKKLKKHS